MRREGEGRKMKVDKGRKRKGERIERMGERRKGKMGKEGKRGEGKCMEGERERNEC